MCECAVAVAFNHQILKRILQNNRKLQVRCCPERISARLCRQYLTLINDLKFLYNLYILFSINFIITVYGVFDCRYSHYISLQLAETKPEICNFAADSMPRRLRLEECYSKVQLCVHTGVLVSRAVATIGAWGGQGPPTNRFGPPTKHLGN